MGFESYTIQQLREDRDAAITRRNRELKLIDEIEGHIRQREAQAKKPQNTPIEASTAA